MIVSSSDSIEISRIGTSGVTTVFTAPADGIIMVRVNSFVPLGGALWRQSSFGARITSIIIGNNNDHNNIFIRQGEQLSEEFMTGISYQIFFTRID